MDVSPLTLECRPARELRGQPLILGAKFLQKSRPAIYRLGWCGALLTGRRLEPRRP